MTKHGFKHPILFMAALRARLDDRGTYHGDPFAFVADREHAISVSQAMDRKGLLEAKTLSETQVVQRSSAQVIEALHNLNFRDICERPRFFNPVAEIIIHAAINYVGEAIERRYNVQVRRIVQLNVIFDPEPDRMSCAMIYDTDVADETRAIIADPWVIYTKKGLRSTMPVLPRLGRIDIWQG